MLPTVLILGGQKCGTSSLQHYLVQHREVGAAQRKEVHYFDLNADKSQLWYRSHFPLRDTYRHTIDSSPYYLFHPAVPQRAHQLVPDAKLIVLLRDPVKRTYSHYHHACRHGLETLDFRAAIDQEEQRLDGTTAFLLSHRSARSYSHQHHSYVSRSIYAPQIARWYEFFDRDQFLFLSSEDLFRDPGEIVSRVQSWLGLSIELPLELTARNAGTYGPLDHALLAMFAERFTADRLEVQALTGRTFPWVAA